MIALDASALIALIMKEPGHERVQSALDGGCLSTVKLAETLSFGARQDFDVRGIRTRTEALPIEIVPFSSNHAALTASLMRLGRPLGLSLGDRACLALALDRNIPVMTADRRWRDAGLELEIVVIR
ncbi:MAG: PIN domain-containing protein [Alphaproteobacteria bacterium]|nr:PIN domain-containing protein [Alphaproteobacteria bacterium]